MDPRLSFPVTHPALTARYLSPQSMANSFNALLDSGCTRHVVRNRALFRDYTENSFSVHTATCGSLEALGSGDVEFRYPFGNKYVTFTLCGCLYAPMAPINLLSVCTLVERGLACLLSPDGITKVSYPDLDPTLPGLTFSATVVNHLSFLLLDFIPPVPSPVPSPVASSARVYPPVVQVVPPSGPSHLELSPPSSLPSSHNKRAPLPKTRAKSEHPHYLVVDATLPSHVFNDRSLFKTYVPSRQLHRNVFGTDIVIEGTGDVHIHVVVCGKSILFRFRDSWHVPSSPHHLFSEPRATSLGNQIMIAGRSPRMIFSHRKCLDEPSFPKYIPFKQVDHVFVLEFNIPTQASVSLSPTTSQSIALTAIQTILGFSLQSPSPCHSFAGLLFDRSSPIPVQLEAPFTPSCLSVLSTSLKGTVAAGSHNSVKIMSHTSLGDGLHGSADGLAGDDHVGLKNLDAIFKLHGVVADQMMEGDVSLKTDIFNKDGEHQAADTSGGGSNNPITLNSSLNFRLFNLRRFTPSSVLHVNSTCFPPLSSNATTVTTSNLTTTITTSAVLITLPLSFSFSFFVHDSLITSPHFSTFLLPLSSFSQISNPPFSTLTLSPFIPLHLEVSTSVSSFFTFSSPHLHVSATIPPFYPKDSSFKLSFIFSSTIIKNSHPIQVPSYLHVNLVSPKTRILAISLHTSTCQLFSPLSVPIHLRFPFSKSRSQTVFSLRSLLLLLHFLGFSFAQAPLLPNMQGLLSSSDSRSFTSERSAIDKFRHQPIFFSSPTIRCHIRQLLERFLSMHAGCWEYLMLQ